jgi:hypothetical protein
MAKRALSTPGQRGSIRRQPWTNIQVGLRPCSQLANRDNDYRELFSLHSERRVVHVLHNQTDRISGTAVGKEKDHTFSG